LNPSKAVSRALSGWYIGSTSSLWDGVEGVDEKGGQGRRSRWACAVPIVMVSSPWKRLLRGVRARVSYANVVATLAILFSMTGAAVAAKHYLINSTSQISPKVLKAIQGRHGGTAGAAGAQGPAGPAGASGPQGVPGNEGPRGTTGPAGNEGPAGQVQKPAVFSKTLSPASEGEETTELFTLHGEEIKATFVCGKGASGTPTASIKITAPTNSRGDSGLDAISAETSNPPEHTKNLVQALLLEPGNAKALGELQSNSAGTQKTTRGELSASVQTPTEAAYIAAYMEASPYGSTPVCLVEGTATSVPLS
jgi:hypothetical protein